MDETTRPMMSGVSGDTGLWLLTVDIAPGRFRGWLRQYVVADARLRPLADVRLTDDDYLQSVENAVYDNPAVLDDFEADIVVTTPAFIFLPEAMKNDRRLCCKAFSAIFGERDDADVMIDNAGAYVCVYMPVPGLNSFLGRTFAGARVRCHIAVLIGYWNQLAGPGARVYADVTAGAVDMALFIDGHLQLAVRKNCSEPTDALYYLLSVCHQASETDDFSNVSVSLSGDGEMVAQLRSMVKDYVKEVEDTPLPGGETDVPLAVSACSYRKTMSKA